MAKWSLATVQEFLNERYPNKYTLLSWSGTKYYCSIQCNCGKQWRPLGMQLTNKGQGCPECGKLLSADKQRTTITQAQQRLDIQGRGLTIVPGSWTDTQHNCALTCKAGHVWETRGTNVLNQGHSCRACFELGQFKWTEGSLRTEAAKYSSKSEFQVKAPNAYSSMYKYFPNLLEELFVSLHESWNEKHIRLLAVDYATKVDFLRDYNGAYRAAKRLGILDELFANQETTFSTREMLYIWKVLNLPNVYKIGITSKSRGLTRIEEVARAAGVKHHLLFLADMGSFAKAISVETLIKKIGIPASLGYFTGYTEFRVYNATELSEVLLHAKNAISLGD